jgi:hypothetical protein
VSEEAYMKAIICIALLLTSCNLTDPEDVFVMQQEDLDGSWYGVSKVESDIQPGYFYDQKASVNIGPVDTSIYSIEKYMTDYYSGRLKFITITVNTYKGDRYMQQAGYLFNRGDEYGSSLTYAFKSTVNGIESPITFTQFHNDSIKITFSTYEYKVGR